jgi:acyl-CoA thioesterase I
MTRRSWPWILVAVGVSAALLAARIPRPRRITPLRAGPGETLVALLGDSITEGLVSFNYVDLLEERLARERYRFLNAGVGGDTAWNLLQRLDPITESCPARVVVQVGTNDVLASLRGGRLNPLNQRLKRLPRPVTPAWFGENIHAIVTALREASAARIALVSIPVLGEDLASEANDEVRVFNSVLARVAEERDVDYLPVHEAMAEVLRTERDGRGVRFETARLARRLLAAFVLRVVLRRTWDEIARHNNLVLTTETLHLNERGAGILAAAIERWLREPAPR